MSKEAALAFASQNKPASTETVAPAESTETTPATQEQPADAKDASIKSDKLAILAKQQANLFKERETLKKEREEFAKIKAEADELVRRGREFDELAQKDKISALKKLGWSDTDIINAVAEGGQAAKPEDVAKQIAEQIAEQKIAKLREELAQEKAALVKERENQELAGTKTGIKEIITSNAEKFEYCAFEPGAEELAFEFIEQGKKDGKTITKEQAVEMAEEYYETYDKQRASLKKRSPKVEEQAPTNVSELAKAELEKRKAQSSANKPNPSRTLSNQVSATSAGVASAAAGRKETPSEKRQRLINQLASMNQ